MTPSNNLFASIDMGTNSFKMLIFQTDKTGKFLTIESPTKDQVCLGRDFSSNLPLKDSIKYSKSNINPPPQQAICVATATVREASNGVLTSKDQFLKSIGFEDSVLFGEEEASFVYLVVSRLLGGTSGDLLEASERAVFNGYGKECVEGIVRREWSFSREELKLVLLSECVREGEEERGLQQGLAAKKDIKICLHNVLAMPRIGKDLLEEYDLLDDFIQEIFEGLRKWMVMLLAIKSMSSWIMEIIFKDTVLKKSSAALKDIHRKKFPKFDGGSLQEFAEELKREIQEFFVQSYGLSVVLQQSDGLNFQDMEFLHSQEGFKIWDAGAIACFPLHEDMGKELRHELENFKNCKIVAGQPIGATLTKYRSLTFKEKLGRQRFSMEKVEKVRLVFVIAWPPYLPGAKVQWIFIAKSCFLPLSAFSKAATWLKNTPGVILKDVSSLIPNQVRNPHKRVWGKFALSISESFRNMGVCFQVCTKNALWWECVGSGLVACEWRKLLTLKCARNA
ncbi:hypothetical protein NC651_012150 [Populus alba x Populus x berolinensis]|nr:hypothetical protein NC651_012150 [Populus alba x Populus x berolinensis]